MTVVLEYRSGKVEIVSFLCGDGYPQCIRLRRVVGADEHGEPEYEARMFQRRRWLKRGKPVYVEEETPSKDAA